MNEKIMKLSGMLVTSAARAGFKKAFGKEKKVYAIGKRHKKRKKTPDLTALLILSAVFPILSERPLIRIRKPLRGDLFTMLLLYSWVRKRRVRPVRVF